MGIFMIRKHVFFYSFNLCFAAQSVATQHKLQLRRPVCECGRMVDVKASKTFHYFTGVGSSPTSHKMDFRFSYYFVKSFARSAVEGWHRKHNGLNL